MRAAAGSGASSEPATGVLVMTEPVPEIDESTLRTLLRHAAADIARSRKPVSTLARGGLNGLLMSLSVVMGFAGLFWLLPAIFLMTQGFSGFPLGEGGVVGGLILFAAGLGLMRLAWGPHRGGGRAGTGRVRVGRRALSTLLLVVSIVVIYAGASDLVFALLSLLTHHSDPQGVVQVAWGFPELAIGLGVMQAARHVRRG